MTKFGQVNAYNDSTGLATIHYVRPDACDKCGACGMGSKTGSIDLIAECKEGDWVRVELPDERFITASALAYGLPLLGFLLGLFLGYFLSDSNELWAIFGSIFGLGLCMLALKINEKRIAGKPEWSPHVVAVYQTKPDLAEIGCSGPM
ncbi:MAG: SoxR reducing system RseC family protein [Clostridiales bacterium]|nr:SoxR reducing system RseC family protein [Clostridiales bacterium]